MRLKLSMNNYTVKKITQKNKGQILQILVIIWILKFQLLTQISMPKNCESNSSNSNFNLNPSESNISNFMSFPNLQNSKCMHKTLKGNAKPEKIRLQNTLLKNSKIKYERTRKRYNTR